MILKKRLFERAEPSEDAKKIFIFCEGKKREKAYFNYFKEIDSRINIEVYELDGQEDNSPLGLYKIAISSIFGDPDNGVLPKYDARASDEVWLVIDVDTDKFDSRTPQIAHINTAIATKSNWALVKSNPCFEVWLYYHLFSAKPSIENIDTCKAWKSFVNVQILGGFDSRKHPVLIAEAIANAVANFSPDQLEVGTTEVHLLGESIYHTIKDKIDAILDAL